MAEPVDRTAGDAVEAPAAPAAPAAPRYVARPLRDSGTGRSWGYLGVIGLVVVAGAAVLFGPNLLAPGAAPSPTPGPSLDPHVVASSVGTFVIAIDYPGQAFVVGRTDGTTTTELGRGVIPSDGPQIATEQPLYGAWSWTMACPGASDGEPIRIVFGALFPADHPEYLGPRASWTVAPDGLFLIVLDPGQVDPAAQIRVNTRSAAIGADVSAFDADLAHGTNEPSGCKVD